MKFFLWLVFAPIFLIILAGVGTELNKAYWDRRVSQLCAEDGGVQLIEKIVVSPQEANNLGKAAGFIALSPKSLKPNAPAYKVDIEEVLHESNPRVIRRDEQVFRMSDGVQTGSLISYVRMGGGFSDGYSS